MNSSSFRKFLVMPALLAASLLQAQLGDQVFSPSIKSIKLSKAGDQYSYPVIMLNSNDQLQLFFDDMDADVKNYYYGYQLCNADWTPTMLHSFDYTRGFQTVRISNYRQSSIAFARYTHYQATFPHRNAIPTRSGNYLLKVFLDGDTSKLVFTKRFLVVDNKTSVAGQVQQPFNASRYNSHQKLQIGVSTDSRINLFTPQDLKVVVLQNYIWPTALYLDRPTIFRGNYYEYNDEAQTSMPAGKEWRWIDLRNLRMQSDRMEKIEKKSTSTDVYVRTDSERRNQLYVYYRDLNGLFTIETTESINPMWQADYAFTHFTFIPPGNRPYEGKSLYVFGELTNYASDGEGKMTFNQEKGQYEATLYLKQGFYNYSYVTVPDKKQGDERAGVSFENTEGNHWNTENTYMILVYYRPFGGRADELIGYTLLNSMLGGRPGY